MNTMTLENILTRRDVWRGGSTIRGERLSAGFDALDARLGGGWPIGALIECLNQHKGIGEMTLFLPALAQATETHATALIDPPHLPYAPALVQAGVNLSRLLILNPREARDSLWAAAQCLNSGACGLVMIWTDHLGDRALRRLQLAAEAGRALAVLFRSSTAAGRPSPATLRLAVHPDGDAGLTIELLKCRGRPPCTIRLPNPVPA